MIYSIIRRMTGLLLIMAGLLRSILYVITLSIVFRNCPTLDFIFQKGSFVILYLGLGSSALLCAGMATLFDYKTGRRILAINLLFLIFTALLLKVIGIVYLELIFYAFLLVVLFLNSKNNSINS